MATIEAKRPAPLPTWLKVATALYGLIFVVSGFLLLVIDNTSDTAPDALKLLKENINVVLAWHLACWMIAGMVANYYWDLVNAGKGFADIQVPRLVLPLLVSPIVFYTVWSLWLTSSSAAATSFIALELLSFQNGFFWQTIFSKQRPAE